MKYGLYDEAENIWIGNEDGPALYEQKEVAKVSALVADACLRQKPGTTRAKPFPKHLQRRLRDQKAAIMTPAQALKKLENGEL